MSRVFRWRFIFRRQIDRVRYDQNLDVNREKVTGSGLGGYRVVEADQQMRPFLTLNASQLVQH